MGIFTRFRDIVSSNLNSILDKAEDPEKMVRQMILEMEETLIEIRSQCAGVIADERKLQRQAESVREMLADWEEKARVAVRREREDLARAALVEKKRCIEREAALTAELERLRSTVAAFREDVAQLESKLQDARDKQRSIIQRKAAAEARQQVRSTVRRVDTSEAFMKFEAYENRIERMEAEADLTGAMRKKARSLREELDDLQADDEIEDELGRLRAEVKGGARAE